MRTIPMEIIINSQTAYTHSLTIYSSIAMMSRMIIPSLCHLKSLLNAYYAAVDL